MKKVGFALILFVLIALPFVFANKGADMLEENGYSVTISEKTELYMTSEKSCNNEQCFSESIEILQVN